MRYTRVMDLGNYEALLEKRRNQNKGVDYRFQELGKEMQKYFNKNIWYLFYRYKEEDLRLAFEECKRYNKPYVPYLIKIIKNKYGG